MRYFLILPGKPDHLTTDGVLVTAASGMPFASKVDMCEQYPGRFTEITADEAKSLLDSLAPPPVDPVVDDAAPLVQQTAPAATKAPAKPKATPKPKTPAKPATTVTPVPAPGTDANATLVQPTDVTAQFPAALAANLIVRGDDANGYSFYEPDAPGESINAVPLDKATLEAEIAKYVSPPTA